MEVLALHTGYPIVKWEYNRSCIFVFEAKGVTYKVKQIDMPVFFLQEKINNGLIVLKYESSSIVPADMCTKPCPGPIISWSTIWMTGFCL